MRITRLVLTVVASAVLFGCTKDSEKPAQATLVAPGVISSEAPEFATTLDKRGNQLFFNRTTPDRSKMWIMRSEHKKGKWQIPHSLPFSTGEYRDVDPFWVDKGDRLFFSSDRPTENDSSGTIFNTWFVEKKSKSWSDPILLGPPIHSDSTEIFISFDKDGTAYFVTERFETRGIVSTQPGVETATPLPLKLRGEEVYASNPAISHKGDYLIVACRDPEGNGRPDLFVAFKTDVGWSEMINLGLAVNTEYAEFAPGLSKDGKYLYFSSERPGLVGEQEEGIRPPGDIYRIKIKSLIKNLKPN